ncbi:hypothetical protein BT63DRAFT_469829 [Microthyrium microscopicum]|uniref:Uncharacterized protein n=1 Tax=Microthyrium microscopicum TaxID=703497 RepID=A0A6A6UF97_9PEZI|nr:hypothetical protein BT63DRAFT_469829 [Microthyrium microscopicum]
MAQSSSAPSVHRWQVALAQVLLKVKPCDVPFTDFLLDLRKDISLKNDKTQGAMAHSYLNGINHWKQQFDQSQKEIVQMQKRISALTSENIQLKSSSTPSHTKRKITSHSNTQYARKRLKSSAPDDSILFDLDDQEVDGLELDARRNIMYHLYAFQDTMEGALNSSVGAAHLIRAMDRLQQMFCDFFHPSKHEDVVATFGMASGSEELRSLQTNLAAITRSMILVIKNISMIADINSHRLQNSFGALVCKYSNFVNDVLAAICDHSVQMHENLEHAHTKKAKASIHKGGDKMLTILMRVLFDLLVSLQPGCRPHFSMFEALVHLIFQRCGRLIHIIHFGHDHCSSYDEEIELEQETFGSKHPNAAMQKAAFQAKYIYPLMKKVVSYASHFKPTDAEDDSTLVNLPKKSYSKLTLDTKQKLTKTLMECIWGEKFDFCADSIAKPVLQGEVPALPRGRGGDEQGLWLTKELWRLLGWEILGREVAKTDL